MILAARPRRIGIDLDNTLVCYDELFHRLALQRGLIHAACEISKAAVRQSLCEQGLEQTWSELQGEAYGPRMRYAAPFADALDFVDECTRRGVAVYVVSHRTPTALVGPAYDLHQAARRWLIDTGVFDTVEGVFLETTRAAKLQRIGALNLRYFVDDLPDVLLDPEFPSTTSAIHFATSLADDAPNGCHQQLRCVGSWKEVRRVIRETL